MIKNINNTLPKTLGTPGVVEKVGIVFPCCHTLPLIVSYCLKDCYCFYFTPLWSCNIFSVLTLICFYFRPLEMLKLCAMTIQAVLGNIWTSSLTSRYNMPLRMCSVVLRIVNILLFVSQYKWNLTYSHLSLMLIFILLSICTNSLLLCLGGVVHLYALVCICVFVLGVCVYVSVPLLFPLAFPVGRVLQLGVIS